MDKLGNINLKNFIQPEKVHPRNKVLKYLQFRVDIYNYNNEQRITMKK